MRWSADPAWKGLLISNKGSILQEDGGDVELAEVTDDGIAKVRLTGACAAARWRRLP